MSDEIKPKNTKPIEEPLLPPPVPPPPPPGGSVQGSGRLAGAAAPPTGVDASWPAAPATPSTTLKPAGKTETGRLYEAFKTLNLTDYSASLLAAYAWSTLEAPETMGRTEAITWAESFRRLNPVPWFSLANGNLNGFVADLERSNLDGLSVDAYAELMTAIRG